MNTPAKKKALATGEKSALLLSASQGTCYNPECSEALIVQRAGKNVVNFEMAHIRDELKPEDPAGDIGWRYWPDDLSQEQRNHFNNLILLCSPCHKLIDKISPRDYPSETLHAWKRSSEGDAGAMLADQIGTVSTSDEMEALLLDSYKKIESRISQHTSEITDFLSGGDGYLRFDLRPSGQQVEVFGRVEGPTPYSIGTFPLSKVSIDVLSLGKTIHQIRDLEITPNVNQHFKSLTFPGGTYTYFSFRVIARNGEYQQDFYCKRERSDGEWFVHSVRWNDLHHFAFRHEEFQPDYPDGLKACCPNPAEYLPKKMSRDRK